MKEQDSRNRRGAVTGTGSVWQRARWILAGKQGRGWEDTLLRGAGGDCQCVGVAGAGNQRETISEEERDLGIVGQEKR